MFVELLYVEENRMQHSVLGFLESSGSQLPNKAGTWLPRDSVRPSAEPSSTQLRSQIVLYNNDAY